ncbi:MAG TPA: D-amino acid dehydrogenase [Geminicoccaceae bacterium]|nr:D-amino acid dehydrogenase [Geminicoccaceae bacterium]
MRVLVMGGGIVGVTTAYQLLQDGHEVVLVERREGAALETSWGNAGMIAPGHAFVWSSPQAPMILLKSLFAKDQALRFRPSADPRLWAWSFLFLRQCTEQRARINTLRKHRLCMYSQKMLHETLASEAVQFDRISRGILYFHRTQEALARAVQHMQILVDDGQDMRVLDRAQVVELEPSLASAGDKIAGGIFCPTDETGDCHKFTSAIAAACERGGAEFRYDTAVVGFDLEGDRLARVRTSRGDLKADVYVMCLGNESPILARQLGVKLPIYPIKGYSLTIPVGNHRQPPTIGSVDEASLVAISRFGDRMRVTATAEFAGYDTRHTARDFDFMLGVARDLYPDGADYDRAQHWAGLRPMTPEGTPIIGRGRYRNLYFNTGQGHMGWTMSHGAARITADLIAGKTPAIPLDGMAVR